jgi:hypothetical protein
MKRYFLIALFLLGVLHGLYAQEKVTISGIILDATNNKPVAGAWVTLQEGSAETRTNPDGKFVLEIEPGEYVLIIEADNYRTKRLPVEAKDQKAIPLGEMFLRYGGSTREGAEIPVISLTESEMSEEGDQMISGLLHSSQDVFVSTAAFNFGISRFKIRGYDSKYSKVFVNGLPMNDMESGWPVWSDWGGLNDATRNKEIHYGLNAGNFSLPAIGGVTNITTRPTAQYPGFKGSYASANKNYNNRTMATYSTGLMDNGWAFTISGSHRWAQEGYIDGTFYDAYAYFVAAEKVINEKHAISFTTFGAPRERGKRGGAPQIFYDKTGTNYYNPYWGYQAGEKRNSRVAHEHKPYFLLNHYWTVSDKLDINTGFAYTFGVRGETRLTWYDASDPRPTYYKKLPYYNDIPVSEYEIEQPQLEWDYYYFANRKNLYTVDDPSNVEGDTYTDNLSKYFVEDGITNHKRYIANANINYELNENINFLGGLLFKHYRGEHYKEVEDLLGGDFWVDIDKFVFRESDFEDYDMVKQNDLNNPNRIVKEGDKFGYDYDAVVTEMNAWGQSEFVFNQSEFYIGLGISNTQYYREGYMKNGKFPEASFGKSDVIDFLNYRVHAGGLNKVTGRHIFQWNMAYINQPPYYTESFVSPRTRDHIVDGLESETILSGDLTYTIRTPFVQGRITGYYTKIEDQTDIISFYHDEDNTFVNYVMNNIDKQYQGIEAGFNFDITSTFSLKTVAALGEYIYSSRPEVTIIKDNLSQVLVEDQTVYVENFFISGTPQTAFSAGIKYDSPKYWWVEASVNYFRDIYLSFNPARRTIPAIVNLDYDSPYGISKAQEITQQEKLNDEFSVDFTGGKSWKFNDYFLSLFLSVDNALNNQDFITGGYEKLRFDYDTKDLGNFPPRYYYAYGRTYYLILSFRF